VNRLPFAQPGRFWRGNLHTHSTRSDGHLEPAETVAWYRDNGYDFVALTDHFVQRFGCRISDTRSMRTGGFTTLIGAELHAPRTQAGNLWHIVAAGLPLDFAPPAPGETGPQLAARAEANGAFVIVAHPAYYGLTVADVETMGAAHALEVFNGASELAYQMGDFNELNPLASALGWHNQIPLKLGALLFFSTVCIAVRHRRLTQLGCYVVTAVYGVLAVVWVSMFSFLLSPHFFQMLLTNF